MLRNSLIGFLFLFTFADDAVKTKLDESNASFEASVKKAEKDLNAAFDDKIELAIKAGNFAAVKRAQAEKEAFEKDRTAPKLANMKVAYANYQRAIKQANLVVEKAYKNAIQEYTKANQLDRAEATNATLAVFKNKEANTTQTAGRRPHQGRHPTRFNTYQIYPNLMLKWRKEGSRRMETWVILRKDRTR